MFNRRLQGEMLFNKDIKMEGAKKHLGRNHTKTQSHEEPPLSPAENGHFWEGGRPARLKGKPWQGCSTAVFWVKCGST